MAFLAIQITAIAGILLSIYAYYIEKKKEKEHSYKAICDINERMSCAAAFSSRYGQLFGISNSIYGLGFYAFVILLTIMSISNAINYIFYLSIASLSYSIYLAYVSYFKLKNFCLVCHFIYLANILLLVFSYLAAY